MLTKFVVSAFAFLALVHPLLAATITGAEIVEYGVFDKISISSGNIDH